MTVAVRGQGRIRRAIMAALTFLLHFFCQEKKWKTKYITGFISRRKQP